MASFYCSRVRDFLARSDEQIIAALAVSYANRGYTSQYSDQTLTWKRDIRSLRAALQECVDTSSNAANWGVLLEFSVPRKETRIDVVLLIGNEIVILESKSSDVGSEARRQVAEYSLLLHYFHKASTQCRIIPIVVLPTARPLDFDHLHQFELFPQLAAYWITNVLEATWEQLPEILRAVADRATGEASPDTWNASPYFPVPSIIEAAIALRSGLSIREIAHCEASEHEIESVRREIQGYVDGAREKQEHRICFLTGVPGSGKTLVGLGLAHSSENQANAIHFMSGNGPLVKVLQHLFTLESRKNGASAPQARTEARTLIENVHIFARYHTDDDLRNPSNHAIIFDEAQRAWNRAQNLKKFGRDYSEPEMLLEIMERHLDWAFVIALVGGGQEINDGEAGLEEWGRALARRNKEWKIYASPEVLEGGPSTAGHRLFDDPDHSMPVSTSSTLHLRTSNRSLRAENLATWVNRVLEGDATGAAELKVTTKFPIFLSRNLDDVRSQLRKFRRGESRFGLVGSSGATRLRAEGLEPSSSFHAEYPWEHWYLAPDADLRSSFRCEVFATEFEIQGLELDWIGMCWGGDFVWDPLKGWVPRSFLSGPNNRWSLIKKEEKQIFRKNAYRVLLTRARQGMILFVPPGSAEDPTRDPAEFDRTAEFLLSCGVTPLIDFVPE